MIVMKLHLIANLHTHRSCDLCSGKDEAIYRFAKSRRARDSGWPLAMGNTGQVPVCRGLASDSQQQHALKLDVCVAAASLTLTD
jgi:hypothetical protein